MQLSNFKIIDVTNLSQQNELNLTGQRSVLQRSPPLTVEMSHKRLVEVPTGDWKNLCALFKPNWPRHILPFLSIENYSRLKFTHKPDTKIFCLDGDWSDGTFILKVYFNII